MRKKLREILQRERLGFNFSITYPYPVEKDIEALSIKIKEIEGLANSFSDDEKCGQFLQIQALYCGLIKLLQ